MRRYLLVDDNRAFAENVAEILGDGGCEVVVAASGPEALRAVEGARYDALVTDMRMPVMGGAELVHALRRVDAGLPAVVVTAYSAESDMRDARREGLLAVLPKPVPIAQLTALLASARRDGLVVLVEDDALFSDNLTEALRGRGFTAVAAASVLEVKKLGALRPLVVLVDLRLPDSPNGEVVQQLTARFPGVPLVVMTGYPERMSELSAAAHVVLTKPFDTAQLLTTLEALHARA